MKWWSVTERNTRVPRPGPVPPKGDMPGCLTLACSPGVLPALLSLPTLLPAGTLGTPTLSIAWNLLARQKNLTHRFISPCFNLEKHFEDVHLDKCSPWRGSLWQGTLWHVLGDAALSPHTKTGVPSPAHPNRGLPLQKSWAPEHLPFPRCHRHGRCPGSRVHWWPAGSHVGGLGILLFVVVTLRACLVQGAVGVHS